MAVFSLNEVRSLQVENKNTNFTSWPEDFYKSNFAENYCFLGSKITRYEFSTDVVSLPGNNVAAWSNIFSSQGTSIANNVTAAVGYISNYPSTIQKFDVTNEVNSSLSGVIPSSDTGYGSLMHATHSPTAFYHHGGGPGIFGRTNINRMPFSDETMVNIGNGAKGRYAGSTVSSPSDDAAFIFAGEIYGGGGAYDYDEQSTIERFTFSTETDAQLGNTPTTYIRRGTTQNSQYGYLIGGIIIPAPGTPSGDDTNLVSRHEFKTGTHTNSVPSAAFPSPSKRSRVSHGIRRSDYGYYGGGYYRALGDHRSNIYKLEFETETAYSSADFPTETSGVQGLLGAASSFKPNHNHMQYGYFFGGGLSSGAPTDYGYISKVDFSTHFFVPSIFATMTGSKGGAVISTNESAWHLGGANGSPGASPTAFSFMRRFDFSANQSVTLPGTHPYPAGVKNGLSLQTRAGDRGYFSHYSSPSTYTNKTIRQENQTETLSDLGVLHPGTRKDATYTGQSTKSYGYSFGGSSGSPDYDAFCTIERLDFSSETVNTLPAQLPADTRFATGAASLQYAHIIGGLGPFSGTSTCRIDRFEYSTETASDFPSSLYYSTYNIGAVSNTYEAFIHGGRRNPAPPFTLSNKSRIIFATDTYDVLAGSNSLYLTHSGDTGVTNTPFK